jgi:hypothetical protein
VYSCTKLAGVAGTLRTQLGEIQSTVDGFMRMGQATELGRSSPAKITKLIMVWSHPNLQHLEGLCIVAEM